MGQTDNKSGLQPQTEHHPYDLASRYVHHTYAIKLRDYGAFYASIKGSKL